MVMCTCNHARQEEGWHVKRSIAIVGRESATRRQYLRDICKGSYLSLSLVFGKSCLSEFLSIHLKGKPSQNSLNTPSFCINHIFTTSSTKSSSFICGTLPYTWLHNKDFAITRQYCGPVIQAYLVSLAPLHRYIPQFSPNPSTTSRLSATVTCVRNSMLSQSLGFGFLLLTIPMVEAGPQRGFIWRIYFGKSAESSKPTTMCRLAQMLTLFYAQLIRPIKYKERCKHPSDRYPYCCK